MPNVNYSRHLNAGMVHSFEFRLIFRRILKHLMCVCALCIYYLLIACLTLVLSVLAALGMVGAIVTALTMLSAAHLSGIGEIFLARACTRTCAAAST